MVESNKRFFFGARWLSIQRLQAYVLTFSFSFCAWKEKKEVIVIKVVNDSTEVTSDNLYEAHSCEKISVKTQLLYGVKKLITLVSKITGFSFLTSDLIFMRKTRHVPKMHDFLMYLRVPDEGSTREKNQPETTGVHWFLIFQRRSSQQSVQNAMV